MLRTGQLAANLPRFLYEGIVALCAAFASLALASWALASLAIARFYEPWHAHFGVVVGFLLFAAVELASGFVPGTVVGLLVARQPLRTSLIAAVLVAILCVLAEASEGNFEHIVSGLFGAGAVATSLLLGTLCTHKFRHA
jgi:hypothetical protein